MGKEKVAYECKRKKDNFTMVKIPCQQCGEPVMVPRGFHGCVFCRDCMTPKSWTLTGKGRVIRK